MTKPLALPERQITALIRGAAKVGHIAEVKVGDVWRPLQAVYPPVIVYIIRCEQFIKIGKSTKAAGRLANLQTANPFPLETIAILDTGDGSQLERDLHKRFAQYRHRGEWFKCAGRLATWIRRGCQTRAAGK